jgi:peptide/nickel transport system ATP-binding protein
MEQDLIHVDALKVAFRHEGEALRVVRGVDFHIGRGEVVGILGESGSGKTVSATAMLRLYEPIDGCELDGRILYEGRNLLTLPERELQTIRGSRIAYVFQNPSNALNPYRKIGLQLQHLMKHHGRSYALPGILNALAEVGLDDPQRIFHMLPGQLSGGQNQRVMLAQVLLCRPELLIADEPTSAIDASMSQKVLDLLATINRNYGMSILVITHDFEVARTLCHRVIIMYGGLVMEEGIMTDIFNQPLHPYTEALIRCSESLNRTTAGTATPDSRVYSLDGTPLTPQEFRDECPFHARCPVGTPACLSGIPLMKHIGNRKIRCIHPEGLKGIRSNQDNETRRTKVHTNE